MAHGTVCSPVTPPEGAPCAGGCGKVFDGRTNGNNVNGTDKVYCDLAIFLSSIPITRSEMQDSQYTLFVPLILRACVRPSKTLPQPPAHGAPSGGVTGEQTVPCAISLIP